MPTVVIVDDHAHFRASARAMLELEGFEIVGEAADGASGVALVEELGPELVLIDVSLPDTSGFEVARRLARGRADIVLVSSRDGADYGAHAQESGARGFIPKDRLSGRSLTWLLEAPR